MPANARIVYDFDTWDAATITGSSEANSDLADDNVVHPFVSKPWRTTGDTTENIVFDLGSAVAIDCIGVFAHNLTSAGTIRVQANTADSWGSPAQDNGAVAMSPSAVDADGNVLGHFISFPSGWGAYRYWRLVFVDGSNPDGYIQIGRIAGGIYYEFDRNIQQSFAVEIMDPSETDRNVPGRQAYWRSRERFRRATVGFRFQDRTQTEKVEAIYRKIGNSNPCILALDPDNYPSKDSMYCQMITPVQFTHQQIGYYDTGALVFEEKVE